ncbi:MAG: ABC transporter ATP-binding protein [Verrucomicrobia bacterium]|nr:MAG: ABC transporter ATP-binding protein [Verrucomicrobiota bacterium]
MENTTQKESPLLEVKDLEVNFTLESSFLGKSKKILKAVDKVSFTVKKGTTVGLVGESGSGKTTIGRAIVKLAPISAGHILYEGQELTAMDEKQFFPYKKKIQMIFQDPFNSLDPRLTIYEIIEEPLKIHFPKLTRAKKRERIRELLHMVNMGDNFLYRHPHALSGGQRQRVGIARALAVEPEFLICDEPVSALDVSVQAYIVNLLQDIQEELGLTYLFIAHDLAVVEHISDEVLVMTNGKIVEQASAETIYTHPKDPYTKKLLEAIPQI